MEKFTVWLLAELNKRGWTPAELAKRAGVDTGNLSRVLNGQRRIGPDACVNIARALGEPPEKLFRLAGLLPDLPPEDATLQELIDYAKTLTREQRRTVLKFARFSKDEAPPPRSPAPPAVNEHRPEYNIRQSELPGPLPPEPSKAPDFEDLMDLARRLDVAELQNVYDFTRFRLEEQERRRDSSSQRREPSRQQLVIPPGSPEDWTLEQFQDLARQLSFEQRAWLIDRVLWRRTERLDREREQALLEAQQANHQVVDQPDTGIKNSP